MVVRALAVLLAASVAAGTHADATHRAASAQPLVTYYYRVSATNAAGESALSNELSATVPASLAIFGDFVAHMQAAAYYAKWVRDNPGDSARWFAFRDAVLTGALPAPPVMTSKYGSGLVDAGRMAEVRG